MDFPLLKTILSVCGLSDASVKEEVEAIKSWNETIEINSPPYGIGTWEFSPKVSKFETVPIATPSV